MPADLIRPTLLSATPADDSNAVARGASIELTFSEALRAGTGKFYITNGATQTSFGADGQPKVRIVQATETRVIDVNDTSQVTIVGNKVIINPTADLKAGTGYSVVIDPGALKDVAGNGYAGLLDANRLNFKTVAVSAPTAAVTGTIAFSADTGASAVDLVTNTAAQAISGHYTGALAAGDTVQVSLDNGTTWQLAAAADGAWSLAATLTASGTVQARVVNGTLASPALAQAYVLDQGQPVLTALQLDGFDGAGATLTVAFSERVGSLDAGDFEIAGGILTDLASSDGGLTWTGTFTTTAAGGSIALRADGAFDVAGNAVQDGAAGAGFGGLEIGLAHDTGRYDDDLVTAIGSGQGIRIVHDGSLATGDTVQIAIDGGAWRSATLDGGTWVLDGVDLTGTGLIAARVIDAAGAQKTIAASHYRIDTTASGGALQGATLTLDDAGNSGSLQDNVTNIARAGITVHLASRTGFQAGDILEVRVAGSGAAYGSYAITAADLDADGTLNFTSKAIVPTGELPGGAHGLMLRLTDNAGNAIDSATLLTVTLDTAAPTLADTAPAEGATAGNGLDKIVLGFDENVVIANGTAFVLVSSRGDRQEFTGGSADAQYDGASHTLTLDLHHALDEDATYTLTTVAALADDAGNAGWQVGAALLHFATAGGAVVIPATPTVALHQDTGSRSGGAGERLDRVTNDRQLDVGKLQPGGSWEYSLDGGAHWTKGSGTTITLPQQSHTYGAGDIVVRQYSGPAHAGTASSEATMGAFTIDVTPPRSTIDYSSFNFEGNGSNVSFYGSIIRNSGDDIVEYTVDGGAHWTRASDNNQGKIEIAHANVPAGGAVGIQLSDAAGNLSTNIDGATSVYIGDGKDGNFTVKAGMALFAQAGNDTISISGTSIARIDGGNGTDTLRFTAGLSLDLDRYEDIITHIERINLGTGGTTASTLRLSADAVEDVTGQDTLTILGDAYDRVQLVGGDWEYEGISGGYKVWSDDDVTVLVGLSVQVIPLG